MDIKGPALPVSDSSKPLLQRVPALVRAFGILLVLYVFLAAVKLMGGGFKGMGKEFADQLIKTTSNPFIGLFVGILVTSVVQSSSLTTSIVVGMVASGTLSVSCAIPIVMGANIGTTVTSTLVSLGFVTRKEEFRRAFSCATMHDFFNLLCVIILLPSELITRRLFGGAGWMQRTAEAAREIFAGSGETEFASPVKAALKPLVHALKELVHMIVGDGTAGAWGQVVLALGLLFFALWAITKLMKSLVLSKLEAVLDRTIGRNALLGFVFGILVTAIVQSSSITTSMLVPLAGAGVMQPYNIFPITVGANLGTTVTALLAALGGGPAGLTIALVHLLFNLMGALIFVPIPAMRRIPVGLADRLGSFTLKSRWYAVLYVATVFFAIPCALIFLT